MSSFSNHIYDTTIGIDPGLSGAIVIYSNKNIIIHDTPIINIGSSSKKNNICDANEMVQILEKAIKGIKPFVIIEKVHAMPSQGVSSTFKFGMGYGKWLGILSALKVPYTEVTPQKWKKAMLEGMQKDKAAAVYKCRQLFPHLQNQLLKTKDGRADALLMAKYGFDYLI